MSVLFTRTIELVLFPPAINFFLMLLGFALLLSKWRKIAVFLITFALSTLYLVSTPAIAYALIDILQQRYHALTSADLEGNKATAIVILGGGRKSHAPEYLGTDTVSRLTLERLRYGAYLQRRTDLPVLVTGGSPLSETTPEAQLMKTALENDFNVRVQWVEDKSHTTLENAALSKALLAQANIQHVYLVTHAWHMPRSVDVFKNTGLEVTPAPTAFAIPSPLEKGGYAWIPTARALETSHLALHEIVGRLWYGLKD